MAKISHFNKRTHKEELAEAPQVEELLKNLEFHKAIQSITGKINSAVSLRDIVIDIKEDIRNLFNIQLLTIYLVDKIRKEIFTFRDDGSEIRFPVDPSTLAGLVVQKKRLIHIADAYNEEEIRKIHDLLIIDRTPDKKTGILTGQILACPILKDRVILGVMEIRNRKGGYTIDDYNQIFLDEITAVLAKALFRHLSFFETRQMQGIKFDSLIKKGVISSDQMFNAINEAAETGEDLSSILINHYSISKTHIGESLSLHYGCPFVSFIADMPIPRDLLIGIEKHVLLNMLWVPLKVTKGKIQVAIDNPSDQSRMNKIEELLETKAIQYHVAIASDIVRFINRFYYSEDEAIRNGQRNEIPAPSQRIHPSSVSSRQNENLLQAAPAVIGSAPQSKPVVAEPEKEVAASVQARRAQPFPGKDMQEQITDRHETPEPSVKETSSDVAGPMVIGSSPPPRTSNTIDLPEGQMPQPLTNLVNIACSRQASDIHLEPDPKAGRVSMRLRIDGHFSLLEPLSYAEYETLTRQIKSLADLDPQNTFSIQSGRTNLKSPSGDEILLRVSFLPTRTGMEDTVIHISSKLQKIPLEQLGCSEKNYTDLVNILHQPRGLILITGPAESGITTTLHACLGKINTQELKIWTAEEPIEIEQNGLRQVQISSRKGFDFATVLTAFQAADPDVIMASAVNDRATAKLCMQAAVKGSLVLGSMWAESIPGTMERCLDLETGHLLFADAMLAIVQQRLIKTLCPKCKEKYHPGQEEYDELPQIYGIEAFKKLGLPYTDAFSLFRPKGCPDCNHTGYLGRMCVSEILIFTPSLKRMIRRKESPLLIYQSAVQSGMTTLMQDGINKVLQGHSDLRHVRLACLR